MATMNKIVRHLWILQVAVVLAVLHGCSSYEPVRVDAPAAHKPALMEYVIGPADELSISVWNHQDLNRTVTVRPDGKFSFSLVGEIQASGLTPLQLQNEMEEALGKFIDVIPGEVVVVVDEVHSYTVSVLGEVRRPGRFEFQSQSTILDALAMAGGLTDFAGKDLVVMRRNGAETEKLEFNYRNLVKGSDDRAHVLIFPGDIIVVR